MSPFDAEKVLADLGFVPGLSSTKGLPPDIRALVKEACRLLKAEVVRIGPRVQPAPPASEPDHG